MNENNNAVDLNEKYFYDILPNGSFETTEVFLKKIFDLINQFIKKSADHSQKILNFHHPEELNKLIDFNIDDEPKNLEFLVKICHSILESVVKTGHPRFFNQLYQGLDVLSLVGAWLTNTTNTNLHTYEVAPVYVLMEKYVIQKMISFLEWQESGDGIFCPGGTIANLYSIITARYNLFPDSKYEGIYNLPKLIVFTSEHGHYAVLRNAAVLGIGLNQVKKVPVDKRGKIIPLELEKMIIKSIEDKEIPLMVSITAGTTVLGAFDPIVPIADICEKYKIWLHVDAAWGGAALLSRKHRHLLNGIERADSVTWNPHKMMGSLLQTSSFLIKKLRILEECNKMSAAYLFQPDKFYDTSYDIGDKTIQCGRQVDVFKIWLLWKARGNNGFEKAIEKNFELAHYFYNQLKQRENYEIVLDNPEFTNICFWYIPNSLRNLEKTTEEYKQRLNKIAPKIKEKMVYNGSMMISYQPQGSYPNFFRIVFCNPATTFKDLDFVLEEIHSLGKDL